MGYANTFAKFNLNGQKQLIFPQYSGMYVYRLIVYCFFCVAFVKLFLPHLIEMSRMEMSSDSINLPSAWGGGKS